MALPRSILNPSGWAGFLRGFLGRWAPPPRLSISQWADRHAYIPPGNAEPGKFHLSRLPYQAAVLDDPLDPTVTETIWMMGKQLLKTTSLTLINGYYIDQDPSTILMVYPTLEDAKTYMRDKLVPFIEVTPRLASKVTRHRSRKATNTVLHKQFPGGNISACGSNSPSSLRQRSRRIVLCDEIDSMRANAEGDPLAQADGRAETYHNAVKIKASTPTIKGVSRIEARWEGSDKQFWFVPCPHCGTLQTLKWRQVKFSFDKGCGPADGHWQKRGEPRKPSLDGTEYRDTANTVYVCEAPDCGAWWSDADRIDAVCQGQWQATATFRGVRGRHLSGLYRILGKKSAFQTYLHEFAEGFLDAQRGGRFSLMVWTNTFLAETWEENAERLDAGAFETRRENYGQHSLPDRVLILTAGVDFQADRAEVQVLGWAAELETFGVAYHVIPGNPHGPQLYADLDNWLANFHATTVGGRRLRLSAVGLDTGFATDHVYAFARPRFARRIFAMKGSNTPGSPLIGSMSRANRRRCPVYRIGTDTAKTEIHANLQIEQPGPGFWHWSSDSQLGFDARYFAGLTAEELTVQYHRGFPRRTWVLPDGRWNEPLDTAVYARAALAVLQPNWSSLARLAGQQELATPPSDMQSPTGPAAQTPSQQPAAPNRPPARRPQFHRPSRGSWMRRWR